MLPLNVRIMLIAGAVFIAFCTGWSVHGWKYDANLKEALQDTIELQQAYDRYAREVVANYNTKEVETQVRKETRDEKIKTITDNRVCFADWDTVRLWNESIADKTDMPKSPRGIDDSTKSASITDSDLLKNINENGARWAECRTKMESIKAFDKKWFGDNNE